MARRDPNSAAAATDDEQFRKFPYDPKKDERLKLLLEQYVEEIQNSVWQHSAIRDLRQLIQTVTNTATWWIPRLLDFVQPHYDALKEYYEKMEAALKEFYEKMDDSDSGEYHDKAKESQEYLADILSVLALTTETPERLCYRYLQPELAKEFAKCEREDKNKVPELNKLLLQIVKYHVQENHESGIESVILLVREEPDCGHSPYDSDCDLGSGKDCDSRSNSDSDFWSKCYREFRRLRGERLKSIIDCTKKVGEFDADLVLDGGLRVTRVYGPGFKINRAFNETEEAYHKSVELVTWLARGACDYYNREKGEGQLVFERLVKAIEIPIQRYYITLAAKGMDGKLKFVRAEVRYGMAVRTMCSIGFTISDPEPFDQAYETMRSRKFVQVKNPFAVQPWKECENVPVSVLIRKILMAGVEVRASDLVVLLQTLVDFNPRLLGELHVALLRANHGRF
ncbi:hypothetical protein Tsubulata_025702 [Turnera subulata]|uniref:RPN1 N-terminal domain-containing protein n=1 Tax=Turnera subulata TaxID=218843 RepID=A0A9Q0G157_9ROSI|nr:hypothetical protein Tsubulata_025702 [Turnera subulata]